MPYYTVDDLYPYPTRCPISKEEWRLRVEWAYQMGRRDATVEILSEVKDTRSDAYAKEQEAWANVYEHLEKLDKEKNAR